MSTMIEDLASRLASVEGRLARLEANANAPKGTAASSSGGGGEALPDNLLDNAWADQEIKRDPKRWDGESQIGNKLSRAPVEWLLCEAGLCDWKAGKGKELPDSDPKKWTGKLHEKGPKKGEKKAWWEGDEFRAKLCRAWAARIQREEAATPSRAQSSTKHDADGVVDEHGDIPF